MLAGLWAWVKLVPKQMLTEFKPKLAVRCWMTGLHAVVLRLDEMKSVNRLADYPESRLFVLICIVWILLLSSMVRADDQDGVETAGAIEGVVTYSGEVPKSKIRDNAGEQRNLISVDRRSRGLRYAVVYLQREESNRPDSEDSEGGKKEVKADPIVIDQIEHTFEPHLIAIRDGQRVKFTNSDVANHNVRAIAFEPKNQFNIFTGAGGDYVHQFVLEKKVRPILLSCDIHPWMRGWIYVFSHPYFAVTDEHGQFRIRSVPAGKYQLKIWQPDVGYRETLSVDVKAGETTMVATGIAAEDLKIR